MNAGGLAQRGGDTPSSRTLRFGLPARRVPGWALILLAAAIATAPQAIRTVSCGHDFDFHLVSWLDCLHAWKQGEIYPRWTPSPNFGAGEPRFVFYPPLTWMLGAALGAWLPWQAVPIMLLFLLLAATGVATAALARRLLEDAPATLAGCLAIFSGYALFTGYERSAYAELAGGFWIPLILLLALRDDQSPTAGPRNAARVWTPIVDGSAPWLAVLLCGAWLSNAPVGVMASYLLAAIALAAALLSRSLVPLVRAGAGTVIGLGIAAFYLVPAAWEQRWVAIRQATDDPGLRIENSFLFGHHAGAALALHDVELQKVSWIGTVMIGLSLAALLVAVALGRLPRERSRWVPLALIPVGILLLQLPVSLPLWNELPKLQFLQFPWRWLVAVEAPMGIFMAAAVWARSRRGRTVAVIACVVAALASGALAGMVFYQACDDDDSVPGMLQTYRAGTGFEGTDEYAPPQADNSLVASGLPGACLVSEADTTLGEAASPAGPDGDTDSATDGDTGQQPHWAPSQHSCDATYALITTGASSGAAERRVQANLPHGGYLVLRLRSYPAWRVRLNGHPITDLPVRDDGLIAVPVEAGPAVIAIDWITTKDVWVGRFLSLASLFIAASLIAAGAVRRRRARLS